MKAIEILKEVEKKGIIEIRPGVWIWTKAAIIEDSIDWAEEDSAKKIDFNSAPYWLTDDSGMEPEKIYSPEDLDEFLEGDPI